MRLLAYPRLRGDWPPFGQSLREPARPAPVDCSDVLITVMYYKLPRVREWEVAMVTGGDDDRFLRVLNVGDDEAFAMVFREFLSKHVGKTIEAIGQADVTYIFE